MPRFEKEATTFCEAIVELAAHPERLENLKSYLSYHFDVWLMKYAKYPAGAASELREFSRMLQ